MKPLWSLILTLLAVVSTLPGCEAKVFRGLVSSRRAWEENGQFVTKFCFHDRKALFKFTVNATAQGRWYFYLDETWPLAFAETDCDKKIAMARFSTSIKETSGQQHVNQWIRAHFWFVVYADLLTCREEAPVEDEVVEYEMVFLNPDSSGQATDHFGDDLRGLLIFYSLLILVYVAGSGLYAHRVWMTISKGGPMHEVLKMLSIAMGLHFCAAVLMLLHLWRYSVNGEGIAVFETFSELLEMLAQCQMVWMLLSMSVGWTLGSQTAHPVRDKTQLGTITAVAVLHVLLVLWEQTYDESHYTYHVHESLPGLLLVFLRVGLTGVFAYNLRRTIAVERSVLRKDFYQSFAFGCYLWFLAFPLLMLLAMVFPAYHRHKVVTVGVTIIQTVSMAMLSRLFLSRSLYWEVSTLSSTTLPLKGVRGGAFMTH